MKKVGATILSLFIFFTGFSQSCLPEGIDFNTQAQVDSFQVDHPDCTEIEGDVGIFGNDVTNLNGLGVLTSIGGNLSIALNPVLTSLTGMNNLTSIGGNFDLMINEALTSLEGLNHLTSIGGDLNVGYKDDYGNHGNPSLLNLSGLDNLNLIGGDLYIHVNDSLNSLTGLNNLTTIGGSLKIEDSPSLTDLTGLGNLITVGGDLKILRNDALNSLTGLEGLISIGDALIIGDYYGGNYNLTSLSGLQNLASIGGNLEIANNSSLTSLTGLNKDNLKSIADIYIYYNHSLSACAVKSLCDYLIQPDPSSTISIHDNETGCNSLEEVKSACESFSLDDLTNNDWFSIYPNPSSTNIVVELSPGIPVGNTTVDLYNVNAQKVKSCRITEPITVLDISALPAGIYFAKIITDRSVRVSKFIKTDK